VEAAAGWHADCADGCAIQVDVAIMDQPMTITNFSSPYLAAATDVSKSAIRAAGGVVASQNRAASEVGAQVLRDGGNAIDAAVATALALTVVEPWMSGLGGGGALLYYAAKSDTVRCVDFSMVASSGLDPASYPVVDGVDSDLFGWPKVVGNRNVLGASSVAVPGVVDGLALALAEFGSRSWAESLQPAIQLAEQGLQLDWFASLSIAQAAADLQKFPASAADFLNNGHVPFAAQAAPGKQPSRLSRTRLHATLKALADAGPRDFYEGAIAASIAADLQAEGSTISRDDLRVYRARIVTPDELTYRNQRVCVVPGLNGGPTLLAALRSLAAASDRSPIDDQLFVHCARSLRDAWRDRLATMGSSGGESCTTHLSVVDRDGNMVSLTQTLLSLFGSRLTLPATGLLMNNGVMWFDPVPGRPNSIAAGKQPLANFCPALLLGDKGNHAIGGSGGRKIMPAMLQLIALMTDHGLSLDDAIAAPRIDVSGTAWITADPRLPASTLQALADIMPVVLADRDVLPTNYTIATGVSYVGTEKTGAVESTMPWAAAIGVA
jgi:gamma-glutamyltranspeptidase/glutathione hydrolase